MNQKERPSYYAVIPASVRYDKTLPPNAKLLYGEITALTNEKGYCWAANTYFADLYSVTKQTISVWISALEKAGHIRTRLVYRDGTKAIANRQIFLATPIKKNLNTYYENSEYPITKNRKDNNTKKNNTSQDGTGALSAGFGVARRPLAAAAVNPAAAAALDVWLDAAASATGAASRHSLADPRSWEDVCRKAIDEGRALPAFIAALRSELNRTRETPHYFSPRNVLKQMQLAGASNPAETAPPPAYCDDCRETNGLSKIDGRWAKCRHGR